MSNKPVPTHRFNSILALMKAARKYMTHLSGLSKRKSLDRYCDEMDGGMRDLVAHPAVFLFGGWWGVGRAIFSACHGVQRNDRKLQRSRRFVQRTDHDL